MNNAKFSYLDSVWNQTKNTIKSEGKVDNSIYTTYFEHSSLVDLNDSKAWITVPSFLHKVVLSDGLDIINTALCSILSRDKIDSEVFVESEYEPEQHDQPLETVNIEPIKPKVINTDGISDSQTFDNFVVGTSNKEAHAAALACAYRPGQFYTPLFIHGNSGLGKTHLLNSIGNYVKKNHADSQIYYTSSVDFVRQVAESIGKNQIEDFKNQMYDLDVLLIDDIQFLAGKEKSHEIFFHIFNELAYRKKQIVITSDRPPTEIKGLEERLISRFSSGLTVGMDSPEFETSLAILEMKIRNQSVDPSIFDEEVLHYIASNFSKDVRQLEGALNRLLFFSIEFSKSDHVAMDTAISAFKKSGIESTTREITPKLIKQIVSDYYGLTVTQLTGKSRTKAISNARHIAIYLTRKFLDMPYNKIGNEFGRRDHSTIINACDKIENAINSDQYLASAIQEIELKIK
ncbi:chromosomal replication initiator DnaA [Erysipelothrix larvae]|uniref:Chromosomal replication initiator protein DnaA n=1 Tax=Erysipelothrix larvae TaxID=1514105 RepID=A0A109UGC3_9FIRM|nr:chromosomal replication initiator protein DnaA [Erysipelothrix larvae]AMC92430.1 chromosomal replication initiator DnaA [Erysipelothrix larvae]